MRRKEGLRDPEEGPKALADDNNCAKVRVPKRVKVHVCCILSRMEKYERKIMRATFQYKISRSNEQRESQKDHLPKP